MTGLVACATAQPIQHPRERRMVRYVHGVYVCHSLWPFAERVNRLRGQESCLALLQQAESAVHFEQDMSYCIVRVLCRTVLVF